LKYLIFAAFAVSSSLAWAVAGGKTADDAMLKKVFGLNFGRYQSYMDTPEIPIGPRIAITCGHCISGQIAASAQASGVQIIFHPNKDKSAVLTDNSYDSVSSGIYGLPFFENANYSYDIALVILSDGDKYPGPYVSVAKNKVVLNEVLTLLGQGKNTSTPDHLCDGRDVNHKFSYAPFQVIDFYNQKVGFISTAKPAATCWGDSGGYYFRTRTDHSLELVGINSWGTEDGYTETPQVDVIKNFQGFLSGANDLTSTEIRDWLLKVAAEKKLDICGVTKECPSILSPF
jgi:hypothetical protein